ncbi:MAG: DUF3299 domain-containing protein [Pseudomonadota bacterium]
MRRNLVFPIGPAQQVCLASAIVSANLLLGIATAQEPEANTQPADGLSAAELAEPAPDREAPSKEDAQAAKETAPTMADQAPLDISWDDLLPEGELDRLEELYRMFYESQGYGGPAAILEGGPGDSMEQIGTFTTVGELDATMVRIPGYMVPLDFSQDRKLSRFLLVPYFGACIHTPPPPPNQIVFVTADPAVRLDSLWEPVSAVGLLRTTAAYTDTANAAYTLKLSKLEAYEY